MDDNTSDEKAQIEEWVSEGQQAGQSRSKIRLDRQASRVDWAC